jgi:hypothetical protein
VWILIKITLWHVILHIQIHMCGGGEEL